MRVVVAGNNRLACEVLEFLLPKDCDLLVLWEGSDMQRRDVGWERPFRDRARRLERERPRGKGASRERRVLQGPPRDHVPLLEEWKPDLLLSCRLKYKVTPEVIRIPRLGSLNAHFGMLPRYGGVQVIPWAIFNGEKEMGVTWHLMDADWDTGSIVVQRAIPIRKRDTAFTLYKAANRAALAALKGVWPGIRKAIREARPQDAARRTYYTRKDFERLVGMKERLDRAFRFS